MRISMYTKVFITLLLVGMGIYYYQVVQAKEQRISSVYIEAWRDPKDIDLSGKKVDIAFIAFAKIDGTSLYFHKDASTNLQIIDNIKKLKENNKGTKMVLAVGGYGVDGFSDASLDGNRYVFTENIINMVKELNLDGVDIDWEFPAFDAWGTQKSREIDTQNFTSLMKELREKLNRLPHKNKSYILTFASGIQDWYFEKVEVNKVEKYVDYINVMTYDMTGRWSDTTGYNSNLYSDANNKAKISIDSVINQYLSHHINSRKLLLGVPAYSYGWKNVKGDANGAFTTGQPIDIEKVDLSYKSIVDKYQNQNGFKRYYDEQAKAAYLYDGDMYISYEDPEALKEKVKYIKDKDLGGAMVWEYSQDAEDGIVTYLSSHLNSDSE
ncbi:glycosyl hydrolase family 18 protein [Paenibacillus sp. N1-5-1-14]|uniref:glycoside hydrolase family 18 protein n=1 Tax=Paenibacillus radicibacter TaxID=2972488 RepID=UPI002158F5C8|nr:glycosyl hydrolase family 18 protein [Paenibacillus radicibacter]MCR8643298.1 glycosyl hydrolase family 18 protein [Paenibacillus radicibacter]